MGGGECHGEPNLWKVLTVDGDDDEEALGFLALYVDDMAVVGELDMVNTLLERIQQEWKCSNPEFVVEGAYVKFCGFELFKRGDQFILSQQSYAQDLLDRHPGVAYRSTPFPGALDEEPENEVRIQDVRAAQGIVGELLWLSCRTTPDFSFGVSWMGRMVTRAPRQVCKYGEHMLGYLKTTVNMALHYVGGSFRGLLLSGRWSWSSRTGCDVWWLSHPMGIRSFVLRERKRHWDTWRQWQS